MFHLQAKNTTMHPFLNHHRQSGHLRSRIAHALGFSEGVLLLGLLLASTGCKGDDGGGGGGGGEGGTLIDDRGISCEEDSECDDHIYCNGQESCDSGVCRQGERVGCNDGIACTVDLRDEDCDPTTIGSRDADHDGYLDALCCNEQPSGKMKCGTDCDDNKSNVNPESPEVCDFLDNDCNDEVDEGVSIEMYPDQDFDGHGDDAADSVQTCAGAVGVASLHDDCDDEDPEVFLGQFEICDEKDNNCDPLRLADEVKEYAPWYKDQDGDTYGDPESTPIFSCYRPAGRVLSQNDCSDDDNKVNPNATEICDGKDNDCNGWPDAKVSGVNNFEDDDRDGVADADCGGDDCDDTDPRTAGGAEEVCDHIDNDCNGEVDERTVQNIWYIDSDGDGWGVVIGSALASCDPLQDRASKFGDCNDDEASIHPDVTEYCDGEDNDCDGATDEGASVFCKADNALSSCSHGACRIFTCTPGFADVNNDYTDGCEEEAVPVYTGQLNCALDSECTDNNLCNGIESCVQRGEGTECKRGTPVNCDLGTTVIDGNVAIHTGLDIKAIEGVDTITGDLDISYTELTSLVGLESLKTIGGSLIVRGNS